LFDDGVSLAQAYYELNETPGLRAAASRVEALMYALSIRNTAALKETKIRYWLASLSKHQLLEVGDRLLRLQDAIMRKRDKNARAWTPSEVKALVDTYKELRP
jgi:hypothetical protein